MIVSPYQVQMVDTEGRDLPTYHRAGRSYVLGNMGERYALHVSNPTPQRVEVVLSVDGLDALDGKRADYVGKRGYILEPYASLTVEGFRTSANDVAAFRFSSVRNSYAGRQGQARDVGAIGVAFFPERPMPVYPPPYRIPGPPRVRPNDGYYPPSPTAPAPDPSHRSEDAPKAGMRNDARPAKPYDDFRERPGLGTQFGERLDSRVVEVPFVRKNPWIPAQVITLRYNDRPGLAALGIPMPPPPDDLQLRETAEPFRQTRWSQPPP